MSVYRVLWFFCILLRASVWHLEVFRSVNRSRGKTVGCDEDFCSVKRRVNLIIFREIERREMIQPSGRNEKWRFSRRNCNHRACECKLVWWFDISCVFTNRVFSPIRHWRYGVWMLGYAKHGRFYVRLDVFFVTFCQFLRWFLSNKWPSRF